MIILRLLLLVDFLRRGNGVLEIDRDFLLTIICVLVRVAAVVAVCVALAVVIVFREVDLDIIVVDHAMRALMMAFVFLRGHA